MKQETNVSKKILLMEIIGEGIEVLSSMKIEEKEEDQSFYFKKVKSTYYKEK